MRPREDVGRKRFYNYTTLHAVLDALLAKKFADVERLVDLMCRYPQSVTRPSGGYQTVTATNDPYHPSGYPALEREVGIASACSVSKTCRRNVQV